MREAFVRTDNAFLSSGGNDGTTALVALVRDKVLQVANVSDYRAVLVQQRGWRGATSGGGGGSGDGSGGGGAGGSSGRAAGAKLSMLVRALSVDHKPNRADERERIEAAGGSVLFWGVWRVEGVLAVSRAIGDKLLKAFVSSEPEVQTWARTSEDRYLILATDGVWDALTNHEAGAVVCSQGDDVQAAAELLVSTALRKGSTDNVTAVVIDLA